MIKFKCDTCEHKWEIIGGVMEEEMPDCCYLQFCTRKGTSNAESLEHLPDNCSNEPIIEFENIEKAKECLQQWKCRLFLDDWIIRLKFGHVKGGVGLIEYEPVIKTAIITLEQSSKEEQGNRCSKYSQECILVHELLHIVFDMPRMESIRLEDVEFHILQHQKTEFMARSLIMAKYGVEKDWFRNI